MGTTLYISSPKLCYQDDISGCSIGVGKAVGLPIQRTLVSMHAAKCKAEVTETYAIVTGMQMFTDFLHYFQDINICTCWTAC